MKKEQKKSNKHLVNKVVILLTIWLISLLLLAGNSFASFEDVGEDHEFIDAILYAEAQGIVTGYPDNTFRADNTITRAEFTKIILNSNLKKSEIYGENCFPDVQTEWFAKYICTAQRKGIIKGYTDGLFHPEYDITFSEASKIISLGFSYEIIVDQDNWQKNFIQKLENKKAIPTSVTKTDKKITRGEMLEIIWRLKENIKYKNYASYDYKQDKLINKTKLLEAENDKIYFGAFPDFGGSEDIITTERITDFNNLTEKNIVWAYFSNNWFKGITYPKDDIHTIHEQGIIPFVRLMPRSSEEQGIEEKTFTMQNIIDGKFDKEIKKWAQDAKEDDIALLIDFAVEMNGDWFSWSGYFNGQGTKDQYGDPNYFDGAERYRDAYRHIIDIFREENVNNITWFFHADIHSIPEEEWNKAKYYYPGDEYIDWIGVSIYGAQDENIDYWESFSDILKERSQSILEISEEKPFAVLEFGVSDKNPLGTKEEWLQDAFETILENKYIEFKAISYWNENWEEEDGSQALIRIDSSAESLETFKKYIADPRFTFSQNTDTKQETETEVKVDTEPEQDQVQEIWIPKISTTWQWQLSGEIDTSYDVEIYDIDLEKTSQETIDEIHEKGAKVICYFNAGAYEPYRSDSAQFPEESLGKIMQGWEDEKWLDISNYEKFEDIMKARLNLAVQKKCDGVEPDNIDGYTNETGFDLKYSEQITYNKWLAEQAHQRGLSIALKNDLDQIDELEPYYDFSINEQCFQYKECQKLTKFTKNNKAVFNTEYELETSEFCTEAKELNFSSLKMEYDLDGGRKSC